MPLRRGEVYFVDLNPTRGREQRGRRPVAILSIDIINELPLVVTVVVGTKGSNIDRDYPTNVRFSPAETGLPEETVFLGFQIRSIDPQRFPKKAAGTLTPEALARLESAVTYC